jgi:hypothetical protein
MLKQMKLGFLGLKEVLVLRLGFKWGEKVIKISEFHAAEKQIQTNKAS